MNPRDEVIAERASFAFVVAQLLDPGLLRTFVAVARTRSFTQAARHLALSQSATSLQVRRLEEALGITLLHRTKRGVQLSAAGEAFIVHAERVLAAHAEAWTAARPSQSRPAIRIGLPDVYAQMYLPRVLDRFQNELPGVLPEVHCAVSTELVARFERGELDVVLFIRHDTEAVGEVLGQERLVWVCGAALRIEWEAPVLLAVYPEYCVFRAHGLRALADAGRDYRIAYTSESTSAIDVAIDHGWGVAIKAARTVSPRWRVLGPEQGLPALAPVEVELRRAPADEDPALDLMVGLLRDAVRDDLGDA